MPLSALRQACNHPNTRHGRYLARSRDITSIGDLLEVLIGKVLTDCEENMRVIISSLNGKYHMRTRSYQFSKCHCQFHVVLRNDYLTHKLSP